MAQSARILEQDNNPSLLNFHAITKATLHQDPYPYLIAKSILPLAMKPVLARDFPDIKEPGFFPLSTLERKGSFDTLLTELETHMPAILTEKLGIELRNKPHMITIRKWSAAKDGRIHTDGKSKIVTCLLYLNEAWPSQEDGGRFRILRSEKSFDSTVAEVSPDFGNFVAFVRADHSWHGHKPFTGERRVIQMTWLDSWEAVQKKEKHGRFSLWLKKWLPGSKY